LLTHRAVLRRTATSYGERVAIIDEAGVAITYTELEARTTAIAEALLAAGLRPGDRVLWLSKNCVEYLLVYFATAKANLVIAPLNYWLRPAELDQLTGLVEPAAVFASSEYAELVDSLASTAASRVRVLLDGHRDGWTEFRSLEAATLSGADGTGALAALPDDEDALHEIIFTSGTTGQSKGVMRSQRKRILDSMNAALAFELGRNDHMVFYGPQFHVGGASVPNQLLVQGGTVSIITFDPAVAVETIKRGVTYIVGVPAHYNLIFESGALQGVDTSRVRGCYVGGSIATRQLFEAITRHFPKADLVHGYGSTESGPHTMALRGQDFLDHYGSLGLPVPGNEVRVAGADGCDVARGEVGELVVRADTVMDGYWKRPDLTAGALSADGWLRTGDLVRQDESGYFLLAGRLKDMIISGGENVYPKEVEDVIATHESVAEVAVIGVPDPIYEERVVALLRVKPGCVAPRAEEITRFVRAQLAGFKTPREVYVVEDFPRTGIGKISKEELKASYGSVFGQRV
jgi:acyl-CoA synthetase (AMP-forming)/AMP-acid ligase II